MLRKAEEAELAGKDIDEIGYEGEPMDTETAKTGAPMAAIEDEPAGITDNARQTMQADNEPEVISLCILFGIKSLLTILQPATSNATPQQEAGNANVSGAVPFAAPAGTASVPNAVLGDGETVSMLELRGELFC